jgi:hypothetical protein
MSKQSIKRPKLIFSSVQEFSDVPRKQKEFAEVVILTNIMVRWETHALKGIFGSGEEIKGIC